MKNIKLIYWSGTGNTKTMAMAILEAFQTNHKDVTIEVVSPDQCDVDLVTGADLLILGSPAMGMEEIDDTEMAPFIHRVKAALKDKQVALFGSYDWGEGMWMEDWENQMTSTDIGAKLAAGSLIIQGAATDSDQDRIREFVDAVMALPQ